MPKDVLLRMVDITKTFPGVKALDHVSLEVKAGTVHALMGENGAGKSTLMKCLFGIYNKDEGHIYLEGKEVNFKSSKEALDNGVAMVHQELNQALKRSVMDNIWLGRYPKMMGIAVNEKKMYKDTKAIFDELDINVDPRRIMSTMPVSQRQMVEIAKAVSYNSKIIVFDEPTSSLTEEEVEHLFKIINMLRDRGVGIIYISHKMAEIKRISDEITVMRDGTWVATRPAAELEMAQIIKLMVGRELTNQFPPKTNKPGEVYLKVEGLTGMYNQLKDVSFVARRGEILGLAGLDSSGRTETLESIFGVRTRKSGVITLDGKLHQKRLCPADGRAPGHRYLWRAEYPGKHGYLQPEAAQADGLLPELQVSEEGYPVLHRCHAHQDPHPGDKNPQPVRRQPAEGDYRPLAADGAGGAAAGRAHPWYRRGRQVRDLPADSGPGSGRQDRYHGFFRNAGAAGCL